MGFAEFVLNRGNLSMSIVGSTGCVLSAGI